jgi:hypothetical protein
MMHDVMHAHDFHAMVNMRNYGVGVTMGTEAEIIFAFMLEAFYILLRDVCHNYSCLKLSKQTDSMPEPRRNFHSLRAGVNAKSFCLCEESNESSIPVYFQTFPFTAGKRHSITRPCAAAGSISIGSQ